MLANQLKGLRAHRRGNHLLHELLVRPGRRLRAALADGLRGKAHIVVNVERACTVVLKVLGVAPLELAGVAPTEPDGEFAPLVV